VLAYSTCSAAKKEMELAWKHTKKW